MKNLYLFITVLCVLTLGGIVPLKAQCMLWNIDNLKHLKQNPSDALYKNTNSASDWFATQAPVTVTHKKSAFSGDVHNYESLSFYSWPDPNNPNGPWIMRPGFANPMYKEYDFDLMLQLQSVIRHFAISFFLTGDETYHQAATRWINTWFVNPETRMNPQMEYSQVRPGENDNRGTCWGIIEAYSMIDIFEGYLLINSIKPFDKETNNKVHAWVKSFSDWLVTSELGKLESTMDNMHSVSYDVILYYFSAFNKDKKQMNVITKRFADERLAKQIDEKGMMPFEMDGRRVFHDHLYNLQHIVDFCVLQKNQGKNFYSKNRKIVDSVFDFLLPYMKAPETFPYTQVSDWDTDISDFKIELLRMSRLNEKYSPSSIGYATDLFETETTVVR